MIELNLETLKAIDDHVWLAYLAALLVMFPLALNKRYIGSSFITVLTVTVVVWFMDSYRDFMLPIINDEALIAQYRTLIRYAWYYGFAGFATAMMVIIWRVHVAFIIPYSYLTRTILLIHAFVVVLQMTRLLERQSFKNELIGETVYQWSIILVNISSAGLAIVFALLAWYASAKKMMIRGI